MGCYGIGVNRTLGAICENNCDEEGLVWPESVAPYQCVIISTPENTNDAEKLYSEMKLKNIDVVLDDRGASFGSKIKDAKLLGFPYMIIVGKKHIQEKLFEVEVRRTSEKLFLNFEKLINLIKN